MPESMSHERAAELLPWLANDSLPEPEKASVLEHARACVICRREMRQLTVVAQSIAAQRDRLSVPEPDMRKINARIDRLGQRRLRLQALVSWASGFASSPWRVAFAVQTVALVVLAILLIWPPVPEPEFTTLTRPQLLPDGYYVRAVFSPEMDDAEFTALLEELGLHIIVGPSARGVFTLGVSQSLSVEERDKLVELLAERPGVLFAQPTVPGADP